jgi:ThiF family/Prokaryotic homologs of the JAB domain
MTVVLRMTGQQHAAIQSHLFPGDHKEAVAILLCGRLNHPKRHALSVHEIFPVPYDVCAVRKPDQITWPTSAIIPALDRAAELGLAVVKIHSHPGWYNEFSHVDDRADRDLFPSIYGWVDDDAPHGSAVMLPDGSIFARTVHQDGQFTPFELVSVAGDDIKLWFHKLDEYQSETTKRTEQAFGNQTTNLLKRLAFAVVGCSGTGGPVIEQLGRYSTGKIVGVDTDVVEQKNLNRIPNSTLTDATNLVAKVLVHERAIRAMGLGTEFIPLQKDIADADVIQAVAACDILIGCMDSAEGRHILNKIAATYCIPYFDVGVRLNADGHGSVDTIVGTVHYLQPDGSSLLSRNVYNMDRVKAELLAKTDPVMYEKLKAEKYIQGVQEERPAVVSVNTFFSSLAMLEILARLHPYRNHPNKNFGAYCINLVEGDVFTQPETYQCCPAVGKHLGRGDMKPMLGVVGTT